MANIQTARRSGLVLRGGRNVRETAWLGGSYTINVIASASTATLVTSLNAAALALRPFTVVRTRGLLSLVSDQTGADEDQAIGFGIAVVSDQATAIGITAIPTPTTDNASDLWFVYESLFSKFIFISGIGVTSPTVMERVIDSKAMRKVDVGEDIVDVLESSGGSGGVRVLQFNRTLIKLH